MVVMGTRRPLKRLFFIFRPVVVIRFFFLPILIPGRQRRVAAQPLVRTRLHNAYLIYTRCIRSTRTYTPYTCTLYTYGVVD